MPGEKVIWRENPKGVDTPWKEHPIWRGACNESPLYEDLFGTGNKVLTMGTNDEYLAWFEPAENPHAEWICHHLSGPVARAGNLTATTFYSPLTGCRPG